MKDLPQGNITQGSIAFYDIRFLAVGHGNMLPIPYANMDKVLQRAKEKLK